MTQELNVTPKINFSLPTCAACHGSQASIAGFQKEAARVVVDNNWSHRAHVDYCNNSINNT